LKRGFLATIEELSSVDAFGCDEKFFAKFEPVWISEYDAGEWSASAGIVDDILNQTANIPMSLSKVNRAKCCRSLPMESVRFENTPLTTPLSTNNSTHLF